MRSRSRPMSSGGAPPGPAQRAGSSRAAAQAATRDRHRMRTCSGSAPGRRRAVRSVRMPTACSTVR
ncbi:hypothetical protein SA15R_10085 [Rothia kristinae]|nr:hypothetical protein SA15R_10085 [Rothia kristinae]